MTEASANLSKAISPRMVALGVVVLGAAAGGGWYVLRGSESLAPRPPVASMPVASMPVASVPAPPPASTVATNPPAPVAQSMPQPAPAKPAPAVAAPSFDIVRVNPAGDTVLAGRAAPGAEVSVTSDGKEIGRTTADSGGQWVLVPVRSRARKSEERP